MLREDVEQIMRHFRDAGGRRDVPKLVGLYAEDAIAISPVFGELRGKPAIAAAWEKWFSTFPDFDFAVSDFLVEGDRAVILGRASSTDQLGWFGLPATGDKIDFRLGFVLKFAGGKIVRDERIFDSTGVAARLEKALLDSEMKTAAELQRMLLSRTACHAPFCESAGDSVPCRSIGGDFFEFVELPSGGLGVAIGDVAGKGPAAALLAAMLQGMFLAEAGSGCGPATVLARLNQRLLQRHLAPRFATLVYAELSPDGRMVYSNAGHNPPALLAMEGVRRLTTGGPILGAFEDAAFPEETIHLSDRDTLVFFTDGVIEARNPQGEEFGEDRLLAGLSANATSPPKTLLNEVFSSVREFCDQTELSDDATLTITRFCLPH
jgi:sigma-B regulation protein RsbU (phosphoserine phosphatase)